MHQTIFAGEEFHKGTEIFDGNDLAAVDFPDLGFGAHPGNGIAGNLHAFFRDRVDVHCAIVFDVDLAAGLFDQLLDVLSTRPDQSADLLRVDLERLNPRGVLAQFLARGAERFGHLA